MADEDLISVDYEIFGRVQGVFFRKYTQVSLTLSLYSYDYHFLTIMTSLLPSTISIIIIIIIPFAFFFLFQAEGKKLGLVGWVQNTPAGTVQGQLQGPRKKVKEMQEWLRSTGSPKSQITKAEFKNEKEVDSLEHSSFNVVK